MKVWRFDDSAVRSHVIADDRDEAIQIFDRVMGREYRENLDDVTMEIYEIDNDVELPISDDESGGNFVTKTAGEWMRDRGKPCFL